MPSKRSKSPPKARLPPELMLLVVNNVTDTSTLRNLSLTNKTFRYISQGLLFERITFGTSREHSEKFIDILCGNPESRLCKHVKEVKVITGGMIPQEYHKKLKRTEQALQSYSREELSSFLRIDPSSSSQRTTSLKNSASELEFWMSRLWMSCRRSVHTLSFEIVKYYGLEGIEEAQINRQFCQLVALSPLMRYDFPKLERLELKGTHPRSLSAFMRAMVLPRLPQYADDPRGTWRITVETENSAFWRMKIGDNSNSASVIQDGIIRDNHWRLKEIKITFTEERPFILLGQGASEPSYDALGFFVHHTKPSKLDLDFRERIKMNDLLCGNGATAAAKTDNDKTDSTSMHWIAPSLPPLWYEEGLEELSLANCIITAGLVPALEKMRKLHSLRLDTVRKFDRIHTWGAVFRSCAALPNLTNVKLSNLHNGITALFCAGPVSWSESEWAELNDDAVKYSDKPLLFETTTSTMRYGRSMTRSELNKFALCAREVDDALGFLEFYRSQFKKRKELKKEWNRSDWILCWHGVSGVYNEKLEETVSKLKI